MSKPEPVWDYSRWYADQAEHLRYEYPLTKDSIVMDVGLFDGVFAKETVRRYGCHVHAFEPVTAFFEKTGMALANESGLRMFNYGLGASNRTAEISIDGDSSSIVPGRGIKSEWVRIRSVIAVMDELQLVGVDLLKLNVEGAEYEILDCLIDSGYISRFSNIQVQFHTFVPDAEARRNRIRERLAETHECMWEYFFVWESWKRKGA